MKNTEMQKKKKSMKPLLRIIWTLYASFSIIIWLPMLDGLISSNYQEASEHISLISSWNVQVHGKEYNNISLNEFSFPPVNKGNWVVLERTLPQELPFDEGVLRLNTKHSAIRLYIDNEIIYEYGFDRVKKNKSVGSGIQFINFPAQYAGKNIRLELIVDENNAFTNINEIGIYQWKYAVQTLLTENRLPMLLGAFLLVFGFIAVIITAFIIVMSPKYFRLILISAFSICMGIWTLCYYNIMTVFTIPLYSISLIEHMALYLAPVPIIAYMYDLVQRLHNRKWTISYWILFTFQFIFVAVIITLHTLDKVHCATTLSFLLVLVIVELSYFFIALLLNLKKCSKNKQQIKLYFVGILVLVAGIGYEIISYSINRYLGYRYSYIKGISSLSIILYIIDLIYIFFMDLTENMMVEKERELLIQNAYFDELTKLHNRRYCSEYMKDTEKKWSKNLAVVCFDVNNLKTVNDTYGHLKGDTLIMDSANIIKETFENYGIVGRMGGDEFIAIIHVKNQDELKKILGLFENNIHKNNRSTQNFPISIAFGYAYNMVENAENIEKLYQIADKRMYNNKKQMKSQISERDL